MTKKEAIEYLKNTLETWDAWREHHEKLCRAIEALLEEVDKV